MYVGEDALNILNLKDCRCANHKFILKDVRSVEPLEDAHGFYGNLVKHYAKVICPECKQETILLLKQLGQTWEIMNTAVTENMIIPKIKPEALKTKKEQTRIENKPKEISNNEFICPECQKVCKSKIGLNAHMKTHQK